MRISSPTNRLKASVTVGEWQWWHLPPLFRCYVAAPPVLALAAIGALAVSTDWRTADLAKFSLLACCGMISVAATPRIMYTSGGLTRDFTTVWVLPAAILLPPVYAALMPIPLFLTMQLFVHRGVVYRTVFTAASISLPYAGASFIFRSFPASFAGPTVGAGIHAATWAVAVAACEIIGGRTHHVLILAAVKLSNPRVRIWDMEWNREAFQGLLAEIDLVVLIALAGALNPALVVLALPTVLLVRRFIIHPMLVAQSRIDAKTGLLNVSTWEREAESELSRSVRTQTPMALALVDIDHFKAVNDTYGHLVGDRVLKALSDTLTRQLRDYDRAGRFGGEEFVLLLAQATEKDACRIAERLRKHVGEMAVPVSDGPGAACVRLTISVGVTAMAPGRTRELTDMLAAADSALYQAKQNGRNRVSVARYALDTELQIGLPGTAAPPVAGPVSADPAGASLGPVALR
jgi:diguanylate cyclase (GGDEF)-like protein